MSEPESTTRAALDPVMVAARAGKTWAIWQVETDPDVTLGDFSGAWIIDETGIQGFAADAEWIEDRDNPGAMLTTVLRYPVIPVDQDTAEALQPYAEQAEVQVVDFGKVELASDEEIQRAKQEFEKQEPGKRQPAWGSIAPLAVPELSHPIDGLDKDATSAAEAALGYARGLREWIRAWNTFDKLRIRRLDTAQEPSGIPLPPA